MKKKKWNYTKLFLVKTMEKNKKVMTNEELKDPSKWKSPTIRMENRIIRNLK